MAERAPGGSTQSVSIQKTQLNSRTDKYVLLSPLANAPLSFRDLLTGLATPSAAAVRSPFIGALQTSRFPAFFFETPSFSRDALDRPFEFVLVAAPSFAGMQADRSPFAAFLDPIDGTADAAVFDNLGGNAVLVAPARGRNVREDVYAHVAPFVRRAPPEQVDALWRRVGEAALKCAEADLVRWLSTAGGGMLEICSRCSDLLDHLVFVLRSS